MSWQNKPANFQPCISPPFSLRVQEKIMTDDDYEGIPSDIAEAMKALTTADDEISRPSRLPVKNRLTPGKSLPSQLQLGKASSHCRRSMSGAREQQSAQSGQGRKRQLEQVGWFLQML